MSAADLANDQDRELTVVTAERDDLKLRLDEAEAVIDAVRGIRGLFGQEIARLERSLWPNDPAVVARLDAVRNAIGMLDGVDGL